MEGITFTTQTPLSGLVIRLALAALCGAIIGLEREIRERPAGLRTHMLTSLAAALFTIIATEMVAQFGAYDDTTQLDPIRVVEAVTAGVAFLAAGTIIQSRRSVKGLTTGAAMWLAGAVGLACGAGLVTIALLGTGFALLVLVPLRILETKFFGTSDSSDGKTSDPD